MVPVVPAGRPDALAVVLVSVVIILSFLVIGIYYFRKMEKSFVDNI